MRLKASFVIENSIIIPLFTGIIVMLILSCMSWHDDMVLKSVKIQVALKLEQENINSNDIRFDEILKNAINQAQEKTILKNIEKEDIKNNLDKYIEKNSQSEFIRKNNAVLKLKE